MECLEDYIGIRGCEDSEPESGLYINDLPGLSMEAIDKVANSEQRTYLGVWTDVKRRALKRFITLTRNWMGLRYQIRNLTQSANLGRLVNNSGALATAAAAEQRGFAFWLSDDTNYRISNLHVVHIQELALYLNTAVNTTVKIYNITDRNGEQYYGDLEFTYSLTGVQGWNRIPVNMNIKADLGIWAVYDSTNINSVSLTVPDSCCDYCSCLCEQYSCCGASVQGITVPNLFNAAITKGTNTFGLSGIVSLQCSWDQFICDNRQNFSTALWYLHGYEYLYERLYTTRLNKFTTIDLEKAKVLRDEFWKIYNEEMESALSGVYIKEDCCVDCNAQVKAVGANL